MYLADFCHSLAYKELSAEHLDGDAFLTFEFKGNRIASFDSVQQPCLSVETEPLVCTLRCCKTCENWLGV